MLELLLAQTSGKRISAKIKTRPFDFSSNTDVLFPGVGVKSILALKLKLQLNFKTHQKKVQIGDEH